MKYTIYVIFKSLGYIDEKRDAINSVKFHKFCQFLQMQKFIYKTTIQKNDLHKKIIFLTQIS